MFLVIAVGALAGANGTPNGVEPGNAFITDPFSISLPAGVTFTSALNSVPVPAAAWLFGSGLGLLGFAKRKQLTV